MTIQEANALVDDFSFVYKGKSISKEMLIECREVIHKALEKQMSIVHCKDCIFARERYGKLECINGISYCNTYNDPNMFCSYGEHKEVEE